MDPKVAALLIEGFVFVLTIGAGLFALYMVVSMLRLRQKGVVYKGGIGQWSWVAHRITGVGILAFLFGHIVDTFAVGFGPEYYNEAVKLYKQWWFAPFEVALIGACIYHAFNGLRIILFDFWPVLALKQKTFAYAQLVITAVAFAPAAIIMLSHAWKNSPFS